MANKDKSAAKRRRERRKYKPGKIKYLLIAEAPPNDESRYFYFKDVKDKDSLFINIMKVIYPKEAKNTKKMRDNKACILKKFKKDGYYLIDSVAHPIEGNSKKKEIKENIPNLIRRIKSLSNKPEFKIILISCSVYDECYKNSKENIKNEGFKIIDKRIPFPRGNLEKEFRKKFKKAIKKAQE